MKRKGVGEISYETIYLMIYANYQEMGIYQQYLRQKQKQRRRKSRNQKRGGIANLTFPVKYILQGANLEKGHVTLTNRAKGLGYQ